MVCSHNQIVLSTNVTIAPDSLIVNPLASYVVASVKNMERFIVEIAMSHKTDSWLSYREDMSHVKLYF